MVIVLRNAYKIAGTICYPRTSAIKISVIQVTTIVPVQMAVAVTMAADAISAIGHNRALILRACITTSNSAQD